MNLFRREVIERQGVRLQGDVFVGVPITWQLIGIFLGAAVVAAAVFLGTTTYPRVEVARGVIQPDLGVAAIIPPTIGTISDIHVVSGEAVSAGQILMSAEADNFLASGQSAAVRILDALRRQGESVDAQIAAMREEAQAEERRLDAQIAGLEEELTNLEDQIMLQRERVTTAAAETQAIREAVERGIIARQELVAREEAVAERRQQLAQMRQSRAARASARVEALRTRERLAARTTERAAQLNAQREEIAQNIATTEQSRAFVLRAPVSGTVSNLAARVGAPLTPDRQVAVIIPQGSNLEARLSVPSAAIGFIARDQEVRLAIDTFPYERFGTVQGTIVEVARTAETASDGALTYPVQVALERPHIQAFGTEQPLVSGMTLTARIVTDRQSLIEWLFEPFFALARR